MSFLDPKKTELCWTPQIATTRKERSQSRGTQKPKRTRKVSRRGKERRGGGEGHPSRSTFLDAVKEATHPRKTFLDTKSSLGANPLKADFVHAEARRKTFLGSRKTVHLYFFKFLDSILGCLPTKNEKKTFLWSVCKRDQKSDATKPPRGKSGQKQKEDTTDPNYQIRRKKSPIFTDSG